MPNTRCQFPFHYHNAKIHNIQEVYMPPIGPPPIGPPPLVCIPPPIGPPEVEWVISCGSSPWFPPNNAIGGRETGLSRGGSVEKSTCGSSGASKCLVVLNLTGGGSSSEFELTLVKLTSSDRFICDHSECEKSFLETLIPLAVTKLSSSWLLVWNIFEKKKVSLLGQWRLTKAGKTRRQAHSRPQCTSKVLEHV